MRAREIKDLAIAREAMSRIPGYTEGDMADRLNKLIDKLLNEAEEEFTEPLRPPTKPTLTDDEIPF